jgi:hypothetical protein
MLPADFTVLPLTCASGPSIRGENVDLAEIFNFLRLNSKKVYIRAESTLALSLLAIAWANDHPALSSRAHRGFPPKSSSIYTRSDLA